MQNKHQKNAHPKKKIQVPNGVFRLRKFSKKAFLAIFGSFWDLTNNPF